MTLSYPVSISHNRTSCRISTIRAEVKEMWTCCLLGSFESMEAMTNGSNRKFRGGRETGIKSFFFKLQKRDKRVIQFWKSTVKKYSEAQRQNDKINTKEQKDQQQRREEASRECRWEVRVSRKWLPLLQLSLACAVGNKLSHYGGSYHHANCGGCRALACGRLSVRRRRVYYNNTYV